ncbi:MAG TPA: metal ABC transporter ATP-binding protein [Capsulimonadaceae bacterium]|jgi:ABC-type Mn2+/Zn2+ transport system ATPase subunit
MGIPQTDETLMTFANVTLGYGRRTILSDLNLELKKGDYIGIVGPNGSGKTTLLHAILGRLKPREGSITMHQRLNYGYVPQAQTMDDHFPLTAFDIVLMGRYRRIGYIKGPSREDRDAAMNALEQVGIPHLANRLFREFSGGQKQRTLMARALASGPDVLVLDEPTNDMDVAAEHTTMELIDELHEKRGLLVLMVSHMLNVVVNHAYQVAIVGDGKVKMGPINEIVTPESLLGLYGLPLDVVQVGSRRVVI